MLTRLENCVCTGFPLYCFPLLSFNFFLFPPCAIILYVVFALLTSVFVLAIIFNNEWINNKLFVLDKFLNITAKPLFLLYVKILHSLIKKKKRKSEKMKEISSTTIKEEYIYIYRMIRVIWYEQQLFSHDGKVSPCGYTLFLETLECA